MMPKNWRRNKPTFVTSLLGTTTTTRNNGHALVLKVYSNLLSTLKLIWLQNSKGQKLCGITTRDPVYSPFKTGRKLTLLEISVSSSTLMSYSPKKSGLLIRSGSNSQVNTKLTANHLMLKCKSYIQVVNLISQLFQLCLSTTMMNQFVKQIIYS